MQLNRQIAFVQSWNSTLLTASLVSIFIVFVMVFLQPFDTFQSEMEWKALKLSGYFFTFWIPIIVLHPLELTWFQNQRQKWTLLNEVTYSLVIIAFTALISYFYHSIVFSDGSVSSSNFYLFFVYYNIPFLPLVLPLLLYLRYRLGKVSLQNNSEENSSILVIAGENRNEELSLSMDQFIYAEAKQNYVDIFFLDESREVNSKMLRATLSSVVDQVSDVHQIHRSYLINLDFVKSLEGNARKRFVRLEYVKDLLPVSKKYFEAIDAYLQARP